MDGDQISGVEFGEDFGSVSDLGSDLGKDFGSVSDLGSDCGEHLGFDLGTDLGFSTDLGFDLGPISWLGTDLGTSLGFNLGSISWNKFAPLRVWYNNNTNDDKPSLEYIGYSSISGYSSDGFKLKEEEGLLDCIYDGYHDFFPGSFLLLFWLWNCIDFTLWMILNKSISSVCTITSTALFCFIEQVIEPYCTTEVSISIISGFFAPSILLVHLLSPLLPTFQSCRPDPSHDYDSSYRSLPVPLHRGRDGRDDIDWDTKIAMLEGKSELKPYLPPLIVDTEEGTKAESKFESNCKPAPLLKIKARKK